MVSGLLKNPTLVFLNGASSAGKTTLAHALQERLGAPYLHIALDQFRDGLPAKFRGLNAPPGTTGASGLNVVPVHPDSGKSLTEVRFGEAGRRMLHGMRRAIRTMAVSGNNVIIDDILLAPGFLEDYLDVLDGLCVYFVGVHCPPAVIAVREAARPGRFPGTAEGHLNVCHAHSVYDLEVDTSRLSPAECAGAVVARMNAGPPRAFDVLRAR